jgi:hypothetical protein
MSSNWWNRTCYRCIKESHLQVSHVESKIKLDILMILMVILKIERYENRFDLTSLLIFVSSRNRYEFILPLLKRLYASFNFFCYYRCTQHYQLFSNELDLLFIAAVWNFQIDESWIWVFNGKAVMWKVRQYSYKSLNLELILQLYKLLIDIVAY